jgi:hypothetical protein
MPTYLQTSGAISLNDINGVFGDGTDLNAYRGQAWYKANGTSGSFSSSNINFNEFYGTGPDAPYSLAYVTATSWDSNNLASYTFSGTSFGTASGSRLVVVAIIAKNTSTSSTAVALSSATIGGVSASINVQETSTGTQQPNVYIASAAVSGGTSSGSVVVNLSKTAGGCSIIVYNVPGATSSYATSSVENTSITTQSTSVGLVSSTAPLIAVAACTENSTTITFSSGLSGVDYQEGTTQNISYGGKGALASSGSVTVTYSKTASRGVLALASYS